MCIPHFGFMARCGLSTSSGCIWRERHVRNVLAILASEVRYSTAVERSRLFSVCERKGGVRACICERRVSRATSVHASCL